MNNSFGNLFKKFRLRAEFYTISEFGESLASEGFIYEDSIFSHWQKNNRIPKNRNLLLSILKIFISKKGITTIKEANLFLEAAGQGYLTEAEIEFVSKSVKLSSGLKHTKKIVDFMKMIGKSKKIPRSGWIREKISDPESVADHSFRLSVLAVVLANHLGVDREKLMHMAIIHDLGEVITGDLVWSRGAIINMDARAEKEIKEKTGIEEVFSLIGMSDTYVKLFDEMIERRTQEARIFWQLDKLEMAMQALEYEKEEGKKLDEFFINSDLQIDSPFLRKILKEIINRRVTT